MGTRVGERDSVRIGSLQFHKTRRSTYRDQAPFESSWGAKFLFWLAEHRLSELLNLPLPTLPSLQSSLTSSFVTGAGSSTNAQHSGEEMGPQSLWADEEEKKFYEDLREWRGEVPAVILGVKDEPSSSTEEAVAKEEGTAAGDGGDKEEVKLSGGGEEPRTESSTEADGAAEIE